MRLPPIVSSLGLTLPLLAGCPGDDAGEDETGSPPDIGTDGVARDCECMLDEDHVEAYAAPTVPSCGQRLCPQVAGSCWMGLCEDIPFVLEDPAALTCALTALRDRTPGIVTWSFAEGGGQHRRNGYVLINDDGTAETRSWGWSDLAYDASDAVLGLLSSPARFEACLAEPEDRARFECLRWPRQSSISVCNAGWSYSKA